MGVRLTLESMFDLGRNKHEFNKTVQPYLQGEIGYSHFSSHEGTTRGALAYLFKICLDHNIDIGGDALRDQVVIKMVKLSDEQVELLGQVVNAWNEWHYIVEFLKKS
jgi:hypothetical protein